MAVIRLEVSYHPTGNYTLTEQRKGERLPHDVQEEGLWTESDKAVFYRSLARYIDHLSKQGHSVKLDDWSEGRN
jgi:hypothetical protein